MKRNRLFIAHGFMASPKHHWFNSLKKQAENLGLEVFIPVMQNANAPKESEWLHTLHENVGSVDDKTWFVGHSPGCISILCYLTCQPTNNIAAGKILVSGFSESIALLPH